MNFKYLLAVIAPFVLALALGASSAVSQAMGLDGWFGLGPSVKAPKEPALDRLEKDLSLKQDQKDTFKGFRKYCRNRLCLCRNQIFEARGNLVDALLEEPEDPEKIEQMRRELLIAYEDCQIGMIKTVLELKKGLDRDQRRRLAEALFRREQRCGNSSSSGCGHGPGDFGRQARGSCN
jgi:hypothetical protein